MDKRLESRLYTRIVQASSGDGGRLMEYLKTMADSASERSARHEAKRKAEGYQRVPIWVLSEELATLRQKYPGPRGGVDWPAVVAAAIRDTAHEG